MSNKKLSNRPQNKNFGRRRGCGGKYSKSIKKQNVKKYNDNPNSCPECNTVLAYDKRKNKFCSSSCAAKNNNKARTTTTKHKTKLYIYAKNATVLIAGPFMITHLRVITASH